MAKWTGLPVAVAPRVEVPGLAAATDSQRSRWAKLSVLEWTTWERVLYLDADTRVRADVSAGWAALGAGWDLALAFSENQDADTWLWHVGEAERAATRAEVGEALQLQAGMMFVARNEQTRVLFATWREEWLRWAGEDQGALVRALQRCPVRVWLLGRPWNGGAVISHRWGGCRRG